VIATTDSDGDRVPYGNDECPQDSNKSVPGSCGGGGEEGETSTNAPKTAKNQFPVRVAAAKKQKQKQTLIATVFPIVSTNAPKTAKRRRPVCVVVE
jgi:hypothetical protein